MQLNQLIIFLFIGINGIVIGQNEPDTNVIQLDDIEISIISNYYQQDGSHSPVTGGVGTEKLSNIAPVVYVKLPLDSARTLNISAGFDYYSSASSDNIDNPYLSDNHVSGASASDIRHYYSLAYQKKNKPKRNSHSFSLSVSSEYDVSSISGGYTFERQSKNKQRDFLLSGKYFFDDWKLIYPVELRNGPKQYLSVDKRHTLSLTASESIILNKKVNLSLTIEPLLQSGLLSTPFHRVYLKGQDIASVEILPSMRLKVPIAVRLNVHIANNIILRTFNRVYWDTWGMTGYTLELETPIKIKDGLLRLYPFYRFHIQSGADYFAGFNENLTTDQYFTSDFDLSGFNTHKAGLGLKIEPLFGIGRYKWVKEQVLLFKSIDIRGSYYSRSDGLNAWSTTLGLNFKIKNRIKKN